MPLQPQPFKVLIAEDLGEAAHNHIRALGPDLIDVTVHPGIQREALLQEIGQFDGLIVRGTVPVDKNLFEQASNLTFVGRAGNGTDNIDKSAAEQRGISVHNTPYANVNSTAEHAIGLMFSVGRKVSQADRQIKKKQWNRSALTGFELQSKTLGIIGTGTIGNAVAKKARALGMRVIGTKRRSTMQLTPGGEHYEKFVSKRELLHEANIVSLHVPLNRDTHNLISTSEFEAMRPGTVIINCSRGGIVNESGLVKALQEGRVAGAGIDTFSKEPPEPGSDAERLSLDERVVATPHVGGQTYEAMERMGEEMAVILKQHILNQRSSQTLSPAPC